MKKFTALFSIAAALAIIAAVGVFTTPKENQVQAQAAGAIQVIAPLTRDIGPLRTLTTAGAGNYFTSDINGYNITSVNCVFNQSSHTGSPSTTFTIYNKDFTSGGYYTLVTSAAITSETINAIYAGRGVSPTTNVSAGYPIAAKWRVGATVGGSTPSVTATIGCSVQ